MTTLTVNIANDKDLPVLEEILNRFGLNYTVDTDGNYPFLKADIEGFLKTQQDFLEGKTPARDWKDIEEDLDRAYN